ncbi:SET domain-containing protein [Hypoxylon trugodes]|uniref:SET domain-containing protein n=1 Tax=Hypoxylon trugodes TaxID=326681 RepID=UPI00219EBB1B|nr:SET domain-containing protein [Hypoxylon trugodes]KAI1393980.1 SET domain-containing protein [Hypoxylon trugodes]
MNGRKPQAMAEFRQIGSAGDEAAFATTNIRRGTRIIAEAPLVMVPPVSDDEELSEFLKIVNTLPEATVAEMVKIFCQPSVANGIKDNTYVQREVWGFHKARRWKDNDGNILQGKKLQKAVKKSLNLCAIYLTNNVQLGPAGKYGEGVFSLYSRVRHSCVPNAHNSWNPTIGRLTIHAIHDIKAGDQIYVDYTGNVCRTRQQRAFSLSATWGITCDCTACTKSQTDQLRYRMVVLDQALAAYTCGASKDLNFEANHGIPKIMTAREALKAAEELARLLRRQNLHGMELCKVYRECSQYALDGCNRAKALDYARKELELERTLLGMDTGHLKEGLYGAKYWFEHLQKKM